MADPMTREKLRDLLSDMECGAGPDGGDIMAACDDLIAQERAEVERLRAELAKRCDLDGCEEFREWLSGEKAEADKRARQAEAERDRLAGQVQGIEQAVHAFFTDADQRGVHLDGMTVDELCDAVMAAIRKGPGR